MKKMFAVLGVGTSSALVCLLVAPDVSTAQRLGAPAAAIETPYQTEHTWALGEIVGDINEMSRYRGKPLAAPPPLTGAVTPWHPEQLAAYAADQFGGGAAKPSASEPADQHGALVTLAPDAILKANAAVSAALKRDMRNPRAHESAALVLAAFGLRESAGGLSDTRWVLNRMTAHLAVAQALRNGQSAASMDGQLAHAALLALSNRQRTALNALDAITPKTVPALAWQRALRIRITEDWRLLPMPAQSPRIEKLEYFRARRRTLRSIRGGQDLSDLREPMALDFARVLQSRSFGVEDGQDVVLDGLLAEISELASVYKVIHQRELPKELPAAIVNVRAGRLLGSGDPQVVPWGAWAEFAQRHIGQSIDKIDYHYRQMLILPDRADQLKAGFDAALQHLTLYPVASVARTKGKSGTEADLRYIARAVDVAVRTPELITFDYWSLIETGSRYEPVSRGMPAKKVWFSPPSAEVPYDAGRRADVLTALQRPAVEALMAEAPHDIGLLYRVAQLHRPLLNTVRALVEPRVDFDMWAIDWAINTARDYNDRLALRRKACELAVGHCLTLADDLIAVDERAAAAEYEKVFRNPALDQISMANSSGWLVSYYERTGQLIQAMDLAQRSAEVYSRRGLATLAHLLERRARVSEADEVFTAAAARYPTGKADLAGFLYRQAVTAKKPEYLSRWNAIQKEVFPDGLQPMAAVMTEAPGKGVFVEQDSDASRRVRLQAGDIIVGVDGWKVESKEQYDAVLAFPPPHGKHKFTAWRGVLFSVELPAGHGMTLKTHPLKGWIE
jgi:hypothetical protein